MTRKKEMTKRVRGKVHGKTIELDEDTKMADGQVVELFLRPTTYTCARLKGTKRSTTGIAEKEDFHQVFQKTKKLFWILLSVPVYIWLGYLLMLGLGRFEELYPTTDRIVGKFIVTLFALQAFGLVVYHGYRCVNAFLEGLRGEERGDT
ncbi:MAG: hypothetical protein ACOC7K_01715 [bacterium]